MEKWIRVNEQLPCDHMIVETKIDDKLGIRNVCNLIRIKNLWYLENMSMYVYYTPTHWRNHEY